MLGTDNVVIEPKGDQKMSQLTGENNFEVTSHERLLPLAFLIPLIFRIQFAQDAVLEESRVLLSIL